MQCVHVCLAYARKGEEIRKVRFISGHDDRRICTLTRSCIHGWFGF